MRTKRLWILLPVAAVIAVALLGAAWFSPGDRVVEVPKRLPPDEPLVTTTRTEKLAVHTGDAFWYYVEVWYNPGMVAGIDRAILEQEVNLRPFEVRSTNEQDLNVNAGTRLYRKAYEIQLVKGAVEQYYQFPPIAVHYRLKNGQDVVDQQIAPEPVFVAARLPADVSGLRFRPVGGTVEDTWQMRLPWFFGALGLCFALLGVVNLGWHRASAKQAAITVARPREAGVVGEAYRALEQNAANGAEPKVLLHQIHHLARLVLAHHERLNWLSDPNEGGVPGPLMHVLQLSEKAYGHEPLAAQDAQEAMADLRQVLADYYGAEEVAAWKA